MDACCVQVVAPEDGGFPREPSQLKRLADGRYLVCLPDCERSHIMLEATNAADGVRELTLEFNHDPRRAEASPKDHFYYRSPDGRWRRKHLEAGPPRLIVPLEPGVTRVAGIPWFTYAEYAAYVESLQDARVQKDIAFTDGGGRFAAYRLRVTNPGGVKHKLRICFGRAAHTNESSGYFMAQGILRWLLSGDPAANLDNIEWTFFLCPDPRAIYEHHTYEEIAAAIYDDGRTMAENYEDALRGRYHIVLVEHMWNNEHGGLMRRTDIPNLEIESYEFNDPLSKEPFDKALYPEVVPLSPVLEDYLAFWPHWHEYGTDHYFHRNGAFWDWKNPGVLSMFNEIIFFGKDSDGALIENVQKQGVEWARATAQVYLRFQKKHGYWDEAHPMGPVDVKGACFLEKPEHILLERLLFAEGSAARRRNAEGQPMRTFHKQYAHGLGMRAGERVTLPVPDGVDGFKANVAMDDACTAAGTLEFAVLQDGAEIWRSRPLSRYESQMVHPRLRPGGMLTLALEGAEGVFGNWGGAKFIKNDPDWQR